MRAFAIQQIIAGIDALDADESAKQMFKTLVCAIGTAHGCKAIQRGERIAFALRLHEVKVSRTTIAARLTARFGISKPQAYRDILKALNLYQKTTPFDTRKI